MQLFCPSAILDRKENVVFRIFSSLLLLRMKMFPPQDTQKLAKICAHLVPSENAFWV